MGGGGGSQAEPYRERVPPGLGGGGHKPRRARGVWWRRRRHRRGAPPRFCSTLWGGKAVRNLPDLPLHPPPSSLLPPPRSFRLLPPSSPKPAASTDLSNGCTFLGAGRGIAERLSRRSKARGSERATPARRAPSSRLARVGRGGEGGELGEERRAAPPRRRGAILHPARGLCSPACGAFAHLAPTPPSRTTAGESGSRTMLKDASGWRDLPGR